MKRLLQFMLMAGVLLWGAPAHATFTLVQHTCNTACAASAACNITVSATGTGNLAAVAEIDDGAGTGPPTITSVSGAGSWTHCANCARANGTNEVDASYNLATTSGVTTITVTLTAAPSGTWRACFLEASSSTGGIALDTGATSSCSSLISSAAPVSCALTTSGANLIIWTAIQWGGTITGNSAPYTNCGATCQPNGNGSARNLNITAGTGSTWTPSTSNTGVNFSVAFKEAAAGGATVGLDKRSKLDRLGANE